MKQRVNVPFWLPLIFFHLLSNCTLYLLGTLSAPGTPCQRPCNLFARPFCFPHLTLYCPEEASFSLFQRAIPQNPIFPAVLIPPVFSLSNGIKPFILPCVEHRYLSLFNILPSYSFSPSKHKKTGGLKRPPAKVNSRKTVYYR